jgi:hypothetical protein
MTTFNENNAAQQQFATCSGKVLKGELDSEEVGQYGVKAT